MKLVEKVIVSSGTNIPLSSRDSLSFTVFMIFVTGDNGMHSATLTHGKPGVLHGTRTYLLQDRSGQVTKTKSISAGMLFKFYVLHL